MIVIGYVQFGLAKGWNLDSDNHFYSLKDWVKTYIGITPYKISKVGNKRV